MISITDIESFLREYSFAKQKIKKLECELIAKMRESYNVVMLPGHGYDAVRSKNKKISKPTEKMAEILIDHFGQEIKRIEGELSGERAILRDIDELISRARLGGKEKEYVTRRYLEDRSREKTEELMAVTNSDRIRRRALDKLEAVRQANTHPAAQSG